MKALTFIMQAGLIALLVARKKPSTLPPSRVPFGVPFSFSEPEATYELNALIDKDRDYTVRLYLRLTLPNSSSHLLDDDSPEEAETLKYLTGLTRDANTGHWIDGGLSASFRIRILQASDNQLVLDHLVSQPKTTDVYMGRYVILAKARLAKGTYNIHVTCLDRAAHLAPVLGELAVTTAVGSR